MTFRLSKAARAYFRTIDERSSTGKFKTLWDKYYFCLMAGLTRNRLGDDLLGDTEFETSFIIDYKDQRHQIIASLISAEICRQSIPLDDKDALQKLMLDLLDHTSVTGLSTYGQGIMNRYADGGFHLVREELHQPYELDVFLRKYHDRFAMPRDS